VSSEPASATVETEPASALETTRLHVGGMHCAACVSKVAGLLEARPEVASSRVNLATETATVAHAPGAADVDGWCAALAAAGYPADRAARGSADGAADARAERAWLLLGVALSAPLLLPMLLAPFGVHWMPGPLWQLLLATPVQFGVGATFYASALRALRRGSTDMDVLVVLGTTAAWSLSVVQLLAGRPELYFEASAVVITLVRLGKWMEGRARHRSGEALRALEALQPEVAHVLRDGREVDVPVEAIAPGARLRVKPSERIPLDGVVRRGRSEVDESLQTGESLPVVREAADEVLGGTRNGSGVLEIEVTRTGDEAFLGQILRRVREAQEGRAPIERAVDRVTAVFVPGVLGIAALTLAGWIAAGLALDAAVLRAVAVLVIACPCALGLATPTAILVGTTTAARRGVLVREIDALERSRRLDTLVFDKTGTLTAGRPEIADRVLEDDDALALAAALQAGSEHPLAGAFLAAAEAEEVKAGACDDFEADPGNGVRGRVAGRALRLGRRAWLAACGAEPADAAAERMASWEEAGHSIVGLADEERGVALGWFALADPPRPEAPDALAALRAEGFALRLLSGDGPSAVERLARAVGIPDWEAELEPGHKSERIGALRDAGHRVAMIGDGVNDAPALASADVGIALASGTDLAVQTADIALVRSDLHLVGAALRIARATTRTIRQNLFWAFAYNAAAIPLAASGALDPVVAGAAMAFSSVSVVGNSLRLRRVERS